ncbi:cobalamin-binding protein [Aestuariicella sp. G3-2]|uniref:cobalamin-binding protein n=1 Tax=Pseudomaricurvus albidus TaxID=2842452 RepID=UPI001C0D70DD|nr:cobalamin-binding protein [Aestuariicella albida]MBU3069689.1 cobalamin-binding protein [Aestuariicella albida]
MNRFRQFDFFPAWGWLTSVLLLSFLVTGYARAEDGVSVTDDLGNVITLKHPAKRIIALAPHIVEVVYAVGSGDKLIGAVNYSDYPQAAKQIPRVGTYKSFSTEAILRLQPDLVLAWYSGNGPQRVAHIQALGIPVYFTEPRKLGDIGESMEKIGVLTGSDIARQERQKFDSTLAELAKTYSGREPVSVFYQVWNDPLQTLNGDHLISDVIRLCGGRNVFSTAQTLSPQVSVESVLRVNPQVIVASGMGEARPEWLDDWRRWPSLQAVSNEQLKFIPPDIIQRNTPRVLQGTQIMCKHLQAARDFYYP